MKTTLCNKDNRETESLFVCLDTENQRGTHREHYVDISVFK